MEAFKDARLRHRSNMRKYLEKFSSRNVDLSNAFLKEKEISANNRFKLINNCSFIIMFLSFFLTFFDRYDCVKVTVLIIGLIFSLLLIYDFIDIMTILINEVKPDKFNPKTTKRINQYFTTYQKNFKKMKMLDRVRTLIENGISVSISMIPIFQWEIVSLQSLLLLFPLLINLIIFEVLTWKSYDKKSTFYLRNIILLTSPFQISVNILLLSYKSILGNGVAQVCCLIIIVIFILLYKRYNKRWEKGK